MVEFIICMQMDTVLDKTMKGQALTLCSFQLLVSHAQHHWKLIWFKKSISAFQPLSPLLLAWCLHSLVFTQLLTARFPYFSPPPAHIRKANGNCFPF